MKFPWHTISMPNGCIAQEKKLANSEKRTHEPRLLSRPQILFEGEAWLSYRLSYHLNKEEIERCPDLKSDRLVLHSCDNGWCINPEHLSLGSQSRNCLERADRNEKWRKGRRSCHTPDGLKRLAEAAARRKGEKRDRSWWKTPEGRAKAAEQSRRRWDKEKGLQKC